MLELLGYSNALLAMVDDAGKFEACLEALTRGTIELGRGEAAHDVDAVLISSAFAGAGFISPEHYRRFVLPYERRVIHGIKAYREIPVYTHTCGRIGDRLELLEETGTNGIDTLDPPPLGDVELAAAKRRVGSRMFLKGNIDPVNTLLSGTREEVTREAVRCIDTAARDGGYILSSACSVPPHTPCRNLEVLSEVAEMFGRYE
jgi:uroporphyrinogen decarboxylase